MRDAGSVAAVVATPEEIAISHRWISAKIEASPRNPRIEAGLLVLTNHDPVLRNTRGGRPLTIGETHYVRGLYCHAVSKIVVRLPGPAQSFSAIVGVDSNPQTAGGRGSVEFSVSFGGKQGFRSAILHEGSPAVPVALEMKGASELLLEVGDGGDGIACDQADWAEAKVVLKDGRTIWLGDLPFVDETPATLAALPFSFVYGGTPSAILLNKWNVKRENRTFDQGRTRHAIRYTDPETKLAVTWGVTEYVDCPTVEWTLRFKNEGTADTPLLSEVQAIDTRFQRGGEG